MQKSSKNKLILFVLILLALGTTVFIFMNSMANSESSFAESNPIRDFLRSIFDPGQRYSLDDWNLIVRKGAHFSEYALLAASLTGFSVLFARQRNRAASSFLPLVCFLSLFAAVIDEFIQSFTGRSSLVSDVLIDFGGSIAGLLFVFLIYGFVRAVRRRTEKNSKAQKDGQAV